MGILDSMDCIKKNVDNLFLKADKMNPDELDANFKAIMKEGEKSVDQSGNFLCCILFCRSVNDVITRAHICLKLYIFFILEEKILLANHMHELMSKYMRRLDLELHKFKMELEADNSGITGLIEKSKNKYDCNLILVLKTHLT